MTFAVKIEELATGDVSIIFFNKAEIWQNTFVSVQLAAKEAERLGVFDSATRRLFEQVMDSTNSGYLAPRVEARPQQLLARGFTKQAKPNPR